MGTARHEAALRELTLAGSLVAALPIRSTRMAMFRAALRDAAGLIVADPGAVPEIAPIAAFEAMIEALRAAGVPMDQMVGAVSRARLNQAPRSGERPPAETVAVWLLQRGVV